MQTLDPIIEQINSESNYSDKWCVTVFNNDYNSFEQVISVLIAATQCSLDEAKMETWEIHNLGKSVVHVDSLEKCEAIGVIIGRIGLQVTITEV